MGISEVRICQTSTLYAKLLDEGRKTLALLLWCQARDTRNELIRYITGQMVHSRGEDGSEECYDRVVQNYTKYQKSTIYT